MWVNPLVYKTTKLLVVKTTCGLTHKTTCGFLHKPTSRETYLYTNLLVVKTENPLVVKPVNPLKGWLEIISYGLFSCDMVLYHTWKIQAVGHLPSLVDRVTDADWLGERCISLTWVTDPVTTTCQSILFSPRQTRRGEKRRERGSIERYTSGAFAEWDNYGKIAESNDSYCRGIVIYLTEIAVVGLLFCEPFYGE